MKRPLLLAAVLIIALAFPSHAKILDTIVFGDAASEAAHKLEAPRSQVITGGLGQPARKMRWDTADTKTREGGFLNFSAKCDPLGLNYVTLKVWGSDTSRTASGILVLYQVEDKKLLQVGDRVVHFREFPPLAWAERPEQAIPQRFYYTTIPLPLSLTQGRNQIELRVVAADMNDKGSLPVYRAYVHQGAYFAPAADDPQGPPPPPAPIRPSNGVMWEPALKRAKEGTIADMTVWLKNNDGDLNQLVEGYGVSWTPAFKNPLVPPRVVVSVDEAARGYFKNPTQDQGWGGKWGAEGERIAKIGAQGFGAALDEVVDLGDPAGPAKRRDLWAKMLKASVDSGRFNRVGPTTAQTIINDHELLKAQRGLVALGSPLALPEAQMKRYLYESLGLEPWLGPDRREGGRNSFMGTNYFLVTPEGLTKENGYVSAYGEVYDLSAGFYPMTGDARIRERAAQMLRARSYFRYPMVDEDGYRSFRMVGPLDWRTHQYFPFDQAYGERGSRLASTLSTRDAYSIGFARQMFGDNQGGSFGTDLGSALALEVLLKEPDIGKRLPMTEGQPDFAWADVDNGVVAIKRGEELTWIEPYWQSRQGLHSIGRTFQITPRAARMSTLRSDLQFDWNGKWSAKPNRVLWDNGSFLTPNGSVDQAYLGDKMLHAQAPADAGQDREEFIGRAAFYATRYGRYLVGLNMDKTNSYELKTPVGFSSAIDLITKKLKTGKITVAPFSAVVLDLGNVDETNSQPHAPKFIEAKAVPGGVLVNWETAGGAVSYTLQRTTSKGGVYRPIASGLGATFPKKWGVWPGGSFFDTTAAPGTTYFYRVAGVNSNGEGYASPESSGAAPTAALPAVQASVDALPAPWKNVNFSGTGSARLEANTFSLQGGGGDFWGGSDGGHFVYQPLAGDGTLVARLTAPGGAYKVGLMIRDSLAPNSPHAAILWNKANLEGHQRGGANNDTGYFGAGAASPEQVWFKLERADRNVAFSWAPDVAGTPGAWTEFGTASPTLGVTAFVGLATTNGAPTFDKVSLSTSSAFVPKSPDAPEGLTATPTQGRVVLNWLPSNRAANYTVKRATTPTGPFTTVGAKLAALSFSDSNLKPGANFHYVVTATNRVGESKSSAPVRVSLPSLVAPSGLKVAVKGTQALLNWKVAGGATGYSVLRSSDGATWATLKSNVSGTTFTDATLAPSRSYHYAVAATNDGSASLQSAPVFASSAPLAPGGIQAVGTGTGATVTWNPVAGASSYRVQRAATSGGAATTVATDLTSPVFTDKSLANGRDGFYRVTAVSPAGESAASPQIKVGRGTGLLGRYFNNREGSGTPLFTRVDPSILFDWGQGSPGNGIGNDYFTVRWTGQIEAPATGTYTFSTGRADDYIKVSVNGLTIQNEQSGTTDLEAGKKYDISIEFRDYGGAAYFSPIFWSSAAVIEQPLPSSRLYPAKSNG